ncbi:MAG: hypothetical protein KYX69_19865 [Sphingomonas sp.]|uniref:hypothetical protein n=1 Tax=Sphingomonas sp. TaxID=28214 RepID=UPI0026166D83|nr:hypothetical protein [Sphingomonas sp.]MDK2769962.1 hypothetical protein [Sphingomonas sp.]
MQLEHTIYMKLGSAELAIAVDFTVTRGRPASGPTYDCGGEPAEPAEAQIVAAQAVIVEPAVPALRRPEKRELKPVPDWMLALIRNDPDINADLLEAAGADA